MEVSVVIPCVKKYDKSKIEGIYSFLEKSKLSKFEVILCTSTKFSSLCFDNIILTNKRPNLKCYAISDKSSFKIMEFGVSKCNYKNVILVSLENFSEDSLSIFSSIEKYTVSDRFNVLYSQNNDLVIIKSYDIRNMLKVCKSFDYKELLNVCDYLGFNILDIKTNDKIDFDSLCNQKRALSKYLRLRKSSLFSTELCEYSKRGN